MRAERAAKSEKKSSKKDKKVEGNKKEANKKEHCLSASRVFDSAHGNNGENVMEQVTYKKLFKLLIDKDLKKTEFAAKAGIS